MAEGVYKVTLSTGKIVLLREMKIKHRSLAIQAASPRSKGDQNLLAVNGQEELLKMLIAQVDGKDLRASDLEDLDSLFSMKEFGQLMHVMGQLMGDDGDLGKPQIEIVPSGGK